jgi:hypothetical protein
VSELLRHSIGWNAFAGGSMETKSRHDEDPPLELPEVLLAELNTLRPGDPGLQECASGPAKTRLADLFHVVHSWSRPAAAPGSAGAAPGSAGAASGSAGAASGSAGAASGGRDSGQETKPPAGARTGPLTALCFSGGGIRSATFNLGVLQGLAKLGLLDAFDYLSSVSGGGFISSWLARWIHTARLAPTSDSSSETPPETSPARDDGGGRAGLDRVIEQLRNKPSQEPRSAPSGEHLPEPMQVVNLRRYSNYLTPRLGLLSADTWTLAAIGVRNILLNWLVLVPIVAAPLLIPLLAVARWPHPACAVAAECPELWWLSAALLILAALLQLTGLIFLARYRGIADRPTAGASGSRPRFLIYGLLPRLAAVPLLLAGFALCHRAPGGGQPRWAGGWLFLLLPAALWAVVLPLVALVSAKKGNRNFPTEAWSALLAGVIEAAVLAKVFASWAPAMLASQDAGRSALYAILGPGLVLGPTLLGRSLFVAFSSVSERPGGNPRQLPDDASREWWARWSGWELISAVVWIVGSALVLLAPSLLRTGTGMVAAVSSASILGTLAALLGKSSATPAQEGGTSSQAANSSQGRLSSVLLALAAPLFVVALVLCLSTGLQHLLALVEDPTWPRSSSCDTPGVQAAATFHVQISGAAAGSPSGMAAPPLRAEFSVQGDTHQGSFWHYVDPYMGSWWVELAALAGLLATGFLLSYPVNINRFSMQAGYRNRLIRAYLGASNAARNPNPFTGFDPADNLALADLWRNRPFPVFNMALNLVRGKNLAWQQRKAECFTATPLHCGAAGLGYRPTLQYGGQGGLTLGTAMATSGAAANPNMGFNSSPLNTFIMTLFTVRLGAWLGNPKTKGPNAPYRRTGPRFSARTLLAEAFGWTDDDHPYVSLSDGAHFENFGLYEMVRRRCHFILVSDAGADPEYQFQDLGNAIRKIRIDFGISIELIRELQILPRPAAGQAAEHRARYCAIADIHYEDADAGGRPGKLVYIKPAICREPPPPVPTDVNTYARLSPDFPHETTADQWFTESQFESYRALGEEVVSAIAGHRPCSSTDELWQRVDDYLGKEAAHHG